MPEIQVPLAGPSGSHKSSQISSALTQNLYAEPNPNPNEPTVMLAFPGCKAWSTGGGVDRGLHVMANILYQVVGTNLQRISSSGARTTLGTVSGSGRCFFTDDGINLCFVTGGVIYKWDGSTLSTVSQSVVTNVSAIAYLNRKFIITGDSGLFAVSNTNDPDTYVVVNFAEEETNPDGLLLPYVFNQLAYMIGEKTIVPWADRGTGNPPLQRQETALVNIGCASRWSVSSSNQFMYLLGDDRQVFQVVGGSFRPIIDPITHTEFKSFSVVSDAIGWVSNIDGHTFYWLTFPTESKTFVYDEAMNYWFRLSYGVDGARHLANSFSNVYGFDMVADYRNGNVYKLDNKTYTDNGEVIRRVRTTLPITANGRDIVFRRLKLICEAGTGLATGQGVDPQVMLSVSHDKGKTWEAEQWRSMGVMGEYEREIEWFSLGRAESFTFRFAFTDPTAFNLYKAVGHVEYGR